MTTTIPFAPLVGAPLSVAPDCRVGGQIGTVAVAENPPLMLGIFAGGA